ncbi:hypothetical protein DOY81_001159 [Sarcophaga bullata]|nr:hypothetical protein DOY81_001159 [Sarcophaga bullata]
MFLLPQEHQGVLHTNQFIPGRSNPIICSLQIASNTNYNKALYINMQKKSRLDKTTWMGVCVNSTASKQYLQNMNHENQFRNLTKIPGKHQF